MAKRGLVLGPGGALGSWQAGCMYQLVQRHKLEFNSVLGISAGALNGAAYFLGDLEELKKTWSGIQNKDILILRPKLFPLSLFSMSGLQKLLGKWVDEEKAKKEGRFKLFVASYCVEDSLPWIATFDPQGRWDSPLMDHLIASCSIPAAFPPVRIQVNGTTKTFLDGGVIGKEKLSFQCVADCEEVFILNTLRPDDPIAPGLNPLTWFNNKAKWVVKRQMEAGIQSLQSLSNPPKIRHIYPGRTLDFYMLDFNTRKCQAAFELGIQDADQSAGLKLS